MQYLTERKLGHFQPREVIVRTAEMRALPKGKKEDIMSDTITIAELERQIAEEKARQVADAKDLENEKLRTRVKELEQEREEIKAVSALKETDYQLNIAAASAREKGEPLNNMQGEIARERAIQKVGGPALWNRLTPAQRATALGISEENAAVKDSDLKRIFGRASSAVEAAQLAKLNPAKYRIWRQIARDRGIF